MFREMWYVLAQDSTKYVTICAACMTRIRLNEQKNEHAQTLNDGLRNTVSKRTGLD